MPVHLLVVPYDSGHRGLRMGHGPLHLTSHGAAARLEAAGHTVAETLVEADPAVLAEIRTAFELNQALAARVGAARAAGSLRSRL